MMQQEYMAANRSTWKVGRLIQMLIFKLDRFKTVQGLMGILTMAIHGINADEVLILTPDFATEMGILNPYHQVGQTVL